MTIPLQPGIVYGPVTSRRFGRSLGINFLPTDRKICSFDCVYCQYGHTSGQIPVFPSLDLIDKEVDEIFSDVMEHGTKIDWIMIAGNGEPTLHPNFPEAIDLVIQFRDRHLFKVPIGILSNASTCMKPHIRSSLLKLDGRFMKLDAGGPRVYQAINHPVGSDSWESMVRGLKELKSLCLQSMFVAGETDNTGNVDVREWVHTVGTIMPQAVQIYTIERPTKDAGIRSVARRKLDAIAKQLTSETGIPATVFG